MKRCRDAIVDNRIYDHDNNIYYNNIIMLNRIPPI